MEPNRQARRIIGILAILCWAAISQAQNLWIPIKVGTGRMTDTAWAYWSATNRSANVTISSDSLTATGVFGNYGKCIATVGASAGKKYFEFTYNSQNTGFERIGIQTSVPTSSDANRLGLTIPNISYRQSGSVSYCVIYNLGAGYLTPGSGCAITTGTVIGYALNMDSSLVRIYVNGTLKVTVTGIPAGTWYPTFGSDGQTGVGKANFGSLPWTYDPTNTLGLTGYTGYYR